MRQVINYPVWNSFTLTTVWDNCIINTRDFRNLVITVIWQNTSVLTLSIYSSNSETQPVLSTTAWEWNEYALTQVINLNTHTLIDWSTWIALVANWVSRYELNENLNNWVWVKLTAKTTWNVKIKFQLSTND